MGRGKRVSEWPGCINFRQVINKYRERYLAAARQEKVRIAEQVIDEIHSIGGRFLKEEVDGSGEWFEVDPDRAVEKTCQALREKEKAKTPSNDPFNDPNKKTVLTPYTSRKKRRIHSRNSDDESDDESDEESDDDDDDDESEDDSDADSDDDDDSDAQSNSSNKKKKKKSKNAAAATAPTAAPAAADPKKKDWIQQIRELDEHEMLKRLNQFKSLYGHCGVPPGWPRDTRLADWCTAQRQVYRQVQAYADKSPAEEELLRELDDMEFVWDYAEWHWKDRCKLLAALSQRKKDTGKRQTYNKDQQLDPFVAAASVAGTSKLIVRWLAHEREQVRKGTCVLTPEQMEDLKRVNMVL